MEVKKTNYVDPNAFFLAMQERIALVKKSKELGIPKPKVSEYIGECIYAIARNYSNLRCYRGYPFRDDMVLDAVENCLLYIDNFNDEVTQNPFAYFTSITRFAFWRRIAKEKKQLYIKSKLVTSSSLNIHNVQEHDESGEFANQFVEYMQMFNNFDGSAFEKKPIDKKAKNIEEEQGLESFM